MPAVPAPDKSKPGMDPGQARMLNFYMDRVLGGDIIVEQNIHVIDVANWFLGGGTLSRRTAPVDARIGAAHLLHTSATPMIAFPGDLSISPAACRRISAQAS
jgi:predicted dehydrogenase